MSELFNIFIELQHSNEIMNKLKKAYCSNMAENCYLNAKHKMILFNESIKSGKRYEYSCSNNEFLVKVIRPIMPKIPKNPAVVLSPKLEVELINIKTRTIKCLVNNIREYIEIPENIQYEF